MSIAPRVAHKFSLKEVTMKRCTRCVLPETFPGIQFDEEGVCQYC